MTPMREIAASDDDDSDFDHVDDDPINDGVDEIQDAPAQHNQAQEGHHSLHDDSNVSTDLSFFQRVYDEQRAVTIAGTYLGTNVTTQGHRPTVKSDQSSSITDPVPASRRPQKRKIGDNIIDLTDLTQVTTPRKSGDGKGKTTEGAAPAQPRAEPKTELPRQSIVRIDPYEFPDDGDDDYTIPPLPKKKTKTMAKRASQTSSNGLPAVQPDATPDHDDISFIPLPPPPSEHAPSSVVQIRSYQKPISSEENPSTSSVSANATQRLYIAPSALTASQKEEYRIVSLSTQETQDNMAGMVTQDDMATQENIPPQSSLPAVPPSDPYPTQMYGEGLLYAGAGTAYKSSGMTTVVPSNLSEIIRGINGDNAQNAAVPNMMTSMSGLGSGSLEMGTPVRVRTNFPVSSPDIIGGGSPDSRTSGRRRKATQISDEDVTQPLESSRLAETREMSAEDSADYTIGTINTHQESTILGNDQIQINEVIEHTTDATASSSTVKKKRGRKKKEPVRMVTEDENALDDSFEATEYQQSEEVSVAVSEPKEPEQPPTKRRRGRPRKSDVAATQKASTPQLDDGDELASPAPTTSRKRGANNNSTSKRKASAPLVIDDSESDGNLSDPPEDIPDEEDPFEAEPEIPPSDENDDEEEEEGPPRKRGRPSAKAAAPAEAPPPTKGKRGRPPKNKVVQEEVSASLAKKNGRSSKSRVIAESEDDDDDQDHAIKEDMEEEHEEEGNNNTREETTPVPDTKPSPEPRATKEEEEEEEEEEEKDKDSVKKEKDDTMKPASFLSMQSQVKYRVGLSKRSRVASLLKVVPRKQ